MSPGMRPQLKAYLGIDHDEIGARHGALSQELGRITAAIEAEQSSGRKPSGELVQALADVVKRLRKVRVRVNDQLVICISSNEGWMVGRSRVITHAAH